MVLENIFTINNLLIFLFNIIGIFIFKYFLLNKNFLLDYTKKIQSTSYKKDIVLIGGIIIFLNILFLELIDISLNKLNIFYYFFVFIIGLISDLKISFKAKYKFIILFLISFIFLVFNKDFIINKISIYIFDELLFNFFIIKLLFTVFCVTLYISGNNMIDGIDGNSISHNIMVMFALIYVINEQNINSEIDKNFFIYFSLVLIILLVFNLKRILFLGDNGSYLLGSIIAIETIYVIKYLNLNPFLASILLFYPCFEVLNSFVFKKDKFQADRSHFHLILHDMLHKKRRYLPLLIILSLNSFFIFLSILNYQNDNYLKIVQTVYFITLIICYYGIKKIKN